jgi:hypothetical protein
LKGTLNSSAVLFMSRKIRKAFSYERNYDRISIAPDISRQKLPTASLSALHFSWKVENHTT